MLEYASPGGGSHTSSRSYGSDGATRNWRSPQTSYTTPFQPQFENSGYFSAPRAQSPYYTRMLPDWDSRMVIPKPSLMSNTDCSSARANFTLTGRNSLQIRREVNAQLTKELAAPGTHGPAFTQLYSTSDRPRADEIEKMVAAFPGHDSIDWDAPDVASGLDIGLWRT